MIRPIGRWVLVQIDEPDAVTRGGLVIPDDAQRQPEFGTVIAAGPGAKVRTSKQERRKTGDEFKFIGVPEQVKPGARVHCGAFNGWELPAKFGERLRMMDAAQDIYLVEDLA